ncbi:hypothetical protein KP79_PYT22028 [Mizuhopecten yessoensis]|uniref:Uncharacterized protein n=1 Tax=Mizuhopecten yessoensis TaxID=6573 RepID=A0A210Q0R3_MIZYE|nr:hypothetical protein KP79_PYT22028 [Mizuhopecten yessoensis]
MCDILSTIENVKRHNYNLNKILDDKDDLTALQSSVKLEDVVRHRTPYHEPVSIEFTHGKVNANHLQQMFGGHATDIETLFSQQGDQAATDFYISTAKGSDFEGTLIRHGRKIVFETTFQHSSYNFVAEMYPWSNKSTWFRLMQENKLELTDRHGHVEKTVSFDTKIRGMTGQSVSGTDSLIVCGVEDRVIKRVEMPSGETTAEFSTGNLYPYAICTALF